MAETLKQLLQHWCKASMRLILHDHVLSSTVALTVLEFALSFIRFSYASNRLVFGNIMPRGVITVRTANRFRT